MLRRFGLATDLALDKPELSPFLVVGDAIRVHDLFRNTEDWQRRYFCYAESEQRLGDDAYAYHKIAGDFIQARFLLLLKLHTLAELTVHKPLTVVGVSRDMAALYQAQFGEPIPESWPTSVEFRLLFNTLWAVVATLFTLSWIAVRVRPNQKIEGHYFLGSDHAEDEREILLWEELSDAPRPVMVVFRSRGQQQRSRDKLKKWTQCLSTDGRMPLGAAISNANEAVCRVARLWWWGKRLPPDMFRAAATFAYRRMIFRALFSRYRFDNFWGRDDYNVEHIFRSQELRKQGGRPIGTSHGLHAISVTAQQTRQVDYDIYYVFGMEVCRRHQATYWPSHMTLRPISNFSLPRAEWHMIGNERTDAVGVVFNPSLLGAKLAFQALRTIAVAFPERTIYFTTRESFRQSLPFYKETLEEFLSTKPDNVVEYRMNVPGRSTYDLIKRCRFFLGEPSTLIAEAVQLGCYAFCLDLPIIWPSMTYREFPGLCVRSGEEFVARMRAIEDGTAPYDASVWADNIDLTGHIMWDMIRADMGLPPKEPPVPALAFTQRG